MLTPARSASAACVRPSALRFDRSVVPIVLLWLNYATILGGIVALIGTTMHVFRELTRTILVLEWRRLVPITLQTSPAVRNGLIPRHRVLDGLPIQDWNSSPLYQPYPRWTVGHDGLLRTHPGPFKQLCLKQPFRANCHLLPLGGTKDEHCRAC
jgi:hypothetical protein